MGSSVQLVTTLGRESYTLSYNQCSTDLVTWGSRRDTVGLDWAGEWLRWGQVVALQRAWVCLTYPEPPGLAGHIMLSTPHCQL